MPSARWTSRLSGNAPRAALALNAVLIILLVWKGVLPGWRETHSDFGNYFVSARLVVEGAPLDSLYNNAWFQEQLLNHGVDKRGKFSPFPPITAWVMLPLTPFDVLTAQRIMVVVNVLLVFVGAVVIGRYAGLDFRYALLLVLISGISLFNNIAFGQLYWIMALCLVLALQLVENRRPLVAGFGLGLFVWLKYFPIVIVASLFLCSMATSDDRRKSYHFTVLSSLGTLIALAVIQPVFFGNGVMIEYLTASLLPHLASELTGQNMYSTLFQSWDSLFRNIFVFHPVHNPYPFIDWDQGRLILKLIVYAVVLTIMLFTMYCYRGASEERRLPVYLTVPSLAAMVLLPATATYHFVLLLVPISVLIKYKLPEQRWLTLIIALYGLIGFIPYRLFNLIAEGAGLIFAYPRLWLSTGLFAVAMIALVKSAAPRRLSGIHPTQ